MEEEKKEKKKRTYKKKTSNETPRKKPTIKKENENMKKESVVSENKEEKEIKEIKVEKQIAENEKDDKFTAVEVIIVMVLSLILGLILGTFIANTRNKPVSNYSNDINKVNEYIEKYYFGTYDKASYNAQTIAGIMSTLNDPYAYFIPREEAATYIEASMGEFVGIGLQIFQNEEGYPQVMKVFEKGPSAKAGIKENDVIIKVDGENIQNLELDKVVSKIKNQKIGKSVTVTIRRDKQEMDFDIVREKVIDPSVTVSYSENTAIIKIENFTDNTYKEFMEAYEKIKQEKVDSLILDLRNNSGNNLNSATKIVEMFIDKGEVLYSLEDNSGTQKVKDKKNKEIKLNTVVIVNQFTSGISELFVSALKDNLGLTVVGQHTTGNSSIQTIYGLEDGSYIRFTTAKWFTPKGESIEGKGVEIDIEANGTEDYNRETDIAFVKALESLKDNSI